MEMEEENQRNKEEITKEITQHNYLAPNTLDSSHKPLKASLFATKKNESKMEIDVNEDKKNELKYKKMASEYRSSQYQQYSLPEVPQKQSETTKNYHSRENNPESLPGGNTHKRRITGVERPEGFFKINPDSGMDVEENK